MLWKDNRLQYDQVRAGRPTRRTIRPRWERQLRDNGLPRRTAMLAYEPDKKVKKEEILELYQKGLTGEEIARTLRIPWSRVWSVVKKLKREEK